MKILYIFPHPDDESFGPAPGIAHQRRHGHDVYLLTLTKGEATKQRHRLGVDKQEMGEIRYNEMQDVAEVLDLNDLTVLDFPDNRLKLLDPRELEETVKEHIRKIEPQVVVTYAVHGISGFPDHLVSHAVVKRAFCELRDRGDDDYLKRLAFFTLEDTPKSDGKFNLSTTPTDELGCVIEASDEDMKKFNQALDCYETYQQVIEESKVREDVTNRICFELFQEQFQPPLEDLTEELPD